MNISFTCISLSGGYGHFYGITNSTDNITIKLTNISLADFNFSNKRSNYLYVIANYIFAHTASTIESSTISMKNINSINVYVLAYYLGYNNGSSNLTLSNTAIDVTDITSKYFYKRVYYSYPDSYLIIDSSNITIDGVAYCDDETYSRDKINDTFS